MVIKTEPMFKSFRRAIASWLLKHKIKLAALCLLITAYWAWLPSKLFNADASSVLLDQNNELLAAKIAPDGQWRFPQSDSVPVKFKTCILTFEDEYFNYHPGFNPVSIFKSFKRNMRSTKIKSGGSTITMQLARMIRKNQPRN